MKNTFVMFVMLVTIASTVGCDAEKPSSFKQESAMNESTQQRLIKQIPAPTLQTSLERKNLVRRAQWVNRENAISYIYLISYGRVMKYFTVEGKVSSLNSYLTAMERVERFGSSMESSSTQYIALEAPDLDGSYGKNPDGIFFFTTEGGYVEWKGEYMWSSEPLFLDPKQPEMIQTVK